MSKPVDVINFRQRRKVELINVMGGKCCLCGYSKISAALEFHHINPETKNFQLSSGNCHSLEKDLEEVKKCILVCSNCHREIHAGIYDNVKLTSTFDNDLAIQLLEEKQNKKRFCLTCEKEIANNSVSGLCFSCITKTRRKAERPSREVLKEKIRILPFTTIASEYGVSDNAVRKWCDSQNLPRKKSDIISIADEDWSKI